VADAVEYLAQVTHLLVLEKGVESGYIMEAEMLCKKSLRIKEKLHGANHFVTVNSKICLINIPSMKGNHDDERNFLMEQCLAINIRRLGINDMDVGTVTAGLANLHEEIASKLPRGNAKTEQLRI
jgi:hypothetical protein